MIETAIAIAFEAHKGQTDKADKPFFFNVEGDNLIVNRTKYIVCVPTYIRANIEMAMPQFKQVKADVYTLENK